MAANMWAVGPVLVKALSDAEALLEYFRSMSEEEYDDFQSGLGFDLPEKKPSSVVEETDYSDLDEGIVECQINVGGGKITYWYWEE